MISLKEFDWLGVACAASMMSVKPGSTRILVVGGDLSSGIRHDHTGSSVRVGGPSGIPSDTLLVCDSALIERGPVRGAVEAALTRDGDIDQAVRGAALSIDKNSDQGVFLMRLQSQKGYVSAPEGIFGRVVTSGNVQTGQVGEQSRAVQAEVANITCKGLLVKGDVTHCMIKCSQLVAGSILQGADILCREGKCFIMSGGGVYNADSFKVTYKMQGGQIISRDCEIATLSGLLQKPSLLQVGNLVVKQDVAAALIEPIGDYLDIEIGGSFLDGEIKFEERKMQRVKIVVKGRVGNTVRINGQPAQDVLTSPGAGGSNVWSYEFTRS